MALLLNVRWERVANGEVVKIGVALLLTLIGYLMYRRSGAKPPSV